MARETFLILALALLVSACGGGDTTEAGVELSREEFIARASAACEDAAAELADTDGFSEVRGEAEFIEFWEQQRQPVLDELESEISGLRAPADLIPEQRDYLAALGESNDLSREDPLVVLAAAIDPDAETAERYAALDPSIEARALNLGLPRSCGGTVLPR